MNPQCARCGKVVYPTEKVNCLDKVRRWRAGGRAGGEAAGSLAASGPHRAGGCRFRPRRRSSAQGGRR